jgi:Ca-activated chloride channel family protein
VSGLRFLAPWALALAALMPLLVLGYRRSLRGRTRRHTPYPDAGLAALAARRARPWRHLPAALYGAALLIGMVTLARPTAPLLVPEDLSGVMLVIETSRSMSAWDIEPTRMVASQEAARALIATIPDGTRVGLATFSGYGTVNVPPTLDRERLLQALALLGTGGDFAFTYGLQAALAALPDPEQSALPPGAIVLFSHGHDNSGNNPLALAAEAAERGIVIHTIGVGTHGNNFGDDLLQLVAERTGGNYFPIFSAGDLVDAHESLGSILVLRPRQTEVTAIVALIAAVLLAASLGASQLRRRAF